MPKEVGHTNRANVKVFLVFLLFLLSNWMIMMMDQLIVIENQNHEMTLNV